MKSKVTEHGVTIPKSLLPDVDEVDIRKRNGMVEVVPIDTDDPVRQLGRSPKRKGEGIGEIDPFPLIELTRNPIDLDITDASVNLDKYIYTRNCP